MSDGRVRRSCPTVVSDGRVRQSCPAIVSNSHVLHCIYEQACLGMFQDYFTPLVLFHPTQPQNLKLVLCKFSKYFQNIPLQKQILTFVAIGVNNGRVG